MADTCGYGEGLSGSINVGNFLTSLLVSFSRTTLLQMGNSVEAYYSAPSGWAVLV